MNTLNAQLSQDIVTADMVGLIQSAEYNGEQKNYENWPTFSKVIYTFLWPIAYTVHCIL